MRPGPDELLHFSEDPTITVFEPHVAPTARMPGAYVWAVDADHSPSYWFPRQVLEYVPGELGDDRGTYSVAELASIGRMLADLHQGLGDLFTAAGRLLEQGNPTRSGRVGVPQRRRPLEPGPVGARLGAHRLGHGRARFAAVGPFLCRAKHGGPARRPPRGRVRGGSGAWRPARRAVR